MSFQKSHINLRLLWLFLLINCHAISAATSLLHKHQAAAHLRLGSSNPKSLAGVATAATYRTESFPGHNGQKVPAKVIIDSLPKTIDDTVIVAFEYRQSTLNYQATFRIIDSVVDILMANDAITFSVAGYSYFEEASDSICYWLSFNRALAVRNYVIGRGVDSIRMLAMEGRGNLRSIQRLKNKIFVSNNYTTEIILNYPVPIPIDKIQDMDEDGIPDVEDSCREEYGDRSRNGCPDRNAIIVPFQLEQSSLFSLTYKVLDSVVTLLHNDPTLLVSIQGHSYKKEGVKTVCSRLAKERADMARRYLLTRQIDAARIESISNFSTSKPLNAGRNPWEITRNARAEIYLIHH